jgi:putative solute:sodium symporter small subunit
MADLTEEQKKSYRRNKLTLSTVLLSIWFVLTDSLSGLWSGQLYQLSFVGFPLG